MPINRAEYIKQLKRQTERAMADAARQLFSEHLANVVIPSLESVRQTPGFTSAMEKKYHIMLYRMGQYIRKVAANSIKPRKAGRGTSKTKFGIASSPFNPPRVPLYRKSDSPLRTLMRFEVDQPNLQLIVGPMKFRPSAKLRIRPVGSNTIAAVLEHGGRQAIRTKLGAKTIDYAPRPFMSLALVKAINAKTFQGLLSSVSSL